MQIHGSTTERTGLCDGRRQHRPRMMSATCAGHSGWRHMLSTHTHTHTLHDRCTVRHTHELAIRTRVQSIVLRRTVRCATRQRHTLREQMRAQYNNYRSAAVATTVHSRLHNNSSRNNNTVELRGGCSSRTYSGTMDPGYVGCQRSDSPDGSHTHATSTTKVDTSQSSRAILERASDEIASIGSQYSYGIYDSL